MTSRISHLLSIFAAHFAVPEQQLVGFAQLPEITRLRNECIWAIQQFEPGQMGAIGDVFGGRALSAVEAAVDRIARRMETDRPYANHMRSIIAAMDAELKTPQPLSDATKVAAAAGVLADRLLSDADARVAALQLLRQGGLHSAA